MYGAMQQYPGRSAGNRTAVLRYGQGLPAAETHLLRLFAPLAHPHGAILELRNFAEGVERRIGQLIGRRLVKAERNEYRPHRRAFVSANIQGNLAAARSDGN